MTDNPANNPANVAGPACPHCGVGIGEHEAARCLDAWVAETVFGAVCDGEYSSLDPDSPECWVWTLRFSRDTSAAWEVLERLRDMDCDVALCSAGATWLVESNVLDVTVRNESAPLAICRAAVLAASPS